MNQSKVYQQWIYILKTPLSINLNINNGKQDCKIGTVFGEGRVNEGD
jgi:hypothetical protein